MDLKSYIITDNSVILTAENDKGKIVPFSVTSSNKDYAKIRKAIENKNFSEALEFLQLTEKFDKKVAIGTKGKFRVKHGVVCIGKDSLPRALSARIMSFVQHKISTKPLEKFWDNLKKNPNASSRRDLYIFLEKNQIPVTPDGCFIAWKRVGNDFLDLYSHSYNNKPGCTPHMDREDVDNNSDNECSRGLHVAEWDYSKHSYGEGRGLLIEVKVNPADVVAVTKDFDFKKMRVCKYKVLRVVKNPDRSAISFERTYYYVGKLGVDFKEDKVSSKKPHGKKFIKVRALDTDDAITKFRRM